MKILIIVFAVVLIIALLSALMSRPNSRVQKISLELVKGLIGLAIISLLMYWLVSSVIF
jgi:hypothetical protein